MGERSQKIVDISTEAVTACKQVIELTCAKHGMVEGDEVAVISTTCVGILADALEAAIASKDDEGGKHIIDLNLGLIEDMIVPRIEKLIEIREALG